MVCFTCLTFSFGLDSDLVRKGLLGGPGVGGGVGGVLHHTLPKLGPGLLHRWLPEKDNFRFAAGVLSHKFSQRTYLYSPLRPRVLLHYLYRITV